MDGYTIPKNIGTTEYGVADHDNANHNNRQPPKVLSWHIPRPSLISSHENSVYTSIGSSIGNYRQGRGSTSTQGSSSSNNSTQSAKSGSMLLTVANLAKIDQTPRTLNPQANINLQYYLAQQPPAVKERGGGGDDALSIASSTHFTVVNGLDRYRNKISQNNSCCRKHKLTVLTLTMSSIFMFGIIVAVYLFEMRAMHLRNT